MCGGGDTHLETLYAFGIGPGMCSAYEAVTWLVCFGFSFLV